MSNRFLDLVVLVAELSQRNDNSFKDLDKELLHLGYSVEEIEQAVFWMSSQLKPLDDDRVNLYNASASRVLSPWESLRIDADSYGYLLRLLNLGVLDVNKFERILARVTPYGSERLGLGEIKVLVGGVIFHLGLGEFDEEPLHDLSEDPPIS